MNKKYRNKTPEICVLESQILSVADFTDSSGATGYIDITETLPIGAIPLAWTTDILAPFSRSVTFAGDPTTLTFNDNGGSADTITDSADGLGDYIIGDSIVIAGSATNDMTVTITGAAAGTLTFATGSVTTDEEVGVTGMTIVGTATVAAAISIGVTGDLDRFSALTSGSVIATAGTVVGSACLAVDACKGINSDQTVRVTITETSDFTDYTAGDIKTNLYYIKTEL